MEDPEQNYCKEYLWLWCADRGWDLDEYEQCKSALVSRYYLQELKSSVLKREVENVCYGLGAEPKICENWCRIKDGHIECQ